MTSGSTVQVLVVDDQATFRMAARKVVERTDGFAVAGEAVDGVAAVEASAGVDLVLMDVHMPGMDGTAATRAIKASSGTTVFLCSTLSNAELAVAAPSCGADGFINKEELSPESLSFLWNQVSAGNN